MSHQTTVTEITNLLKAQYSLLYVCTWEEDRCRDMLYDIDDRAIYVWDLAGGLVQHGRTLPPEMLDPEQILAHIANATTEGIYILRDFHPFLKDAAIVRALRNVTSGNKPIYTPIIITSPVLQIPVELEKIVRVIDFDLPNREQILTLINGAQSAIESQNPTVLIDDVQLDQLVKACQGLTTEEIENILAKSWIEHGVLDVDTILSEKKQIIRKSGVFEYYDNLEEFANVGGMDLLKTWIMNRGLAFNEDAREYGLPQPKGVLLLGIQGCGKSLLCKSIAGLWKMPLIRLDVGKVMQGIVGSSEENMRKAIRVAESIAPAVLFIDEIEKGLAGTGSSNFSDGGTTSRVFSTLLTWLS